jgi:NRAMP (natural resistance-associated macrophage protein)-like metal ion transporter
LPARKTLPLGRRLALFFGILGPGLIAAAAGNEAGGIVTYSNIGATHGFSMLWLLALSTLSLIVTQEMGARMAIVTGKGLADLIREEFGIRVAVFAMGILFVANLATTMAEFAGIAAVFSMLPVPVWLQKLMLFLVAGGLWLLVIRGSYKKIERVFLLMCAVFFVYVIAALQTCKNWGEPLKALITPQIPHDSPKYLEHAIALIGTTIAPWMQFYVQSSVRDKGLKTEALSDEKLDVYIGSTLSNLISFFIIVACAVQIFAKSPHEIGLASEAARALDGLQLGGVLLGPLLFGLGLFNASAVGAVIVPLSTAYATTEAIGSESGLGRKIREAPLFILIFTSLIAISVIVVSFTSERGLMKLVTNVQILNAVLLPIILILMLRLINTKRLMGKFSNGWGQNLIAITTALLVIVLSAIYLFQQLF